MTPTPAAAPAAAAGAPVPPILEIRGLRKQFGGTVALHGIDLCVRRGTVHAVLGGNGSGKSTAIKLLAGIHQADDGTVRVRDQIRPARDCTPEEMHDAGLRFVHQDLGVFPALSISENFAAVQGYPRLRSGAIAWAELHRRSRDLLDCYDVAADPRWPLARLRPSDRTMVAIARALGRQNTDDLVLVLDEPTASLPEHESTALLDAIRRRADLGQTVVLVSHRLGEVLAVADEISVLRDGRNAGTLTREAASRDTIIALMAGRTTDDLHDVAAAPGHAGRGVLRVDDLTAGPLRGLSLRLAEGEIVGIAGLLGSGRSTLLRAIFGAQPVDAGSMSIFGKPLQNAAPHQAMAAGVAYVPEDRGSDAAFGDMSVRDNLSASVLRRYWKHGLMSRKAERSDSAGLVDSFAIKAATVEAPLASLSGGNQQKTVLARWLRRAPVVLLLDEPTQGVDVVARAEIYRSVKAAADAGCSVLIASSDFEELETLCSRVLVLRDGAVREELTGAQIEASRLSALSQADPSPTGVSS